MDTASFAATYVAVWNEPDPAARRRQVEALWRADATYTNALAEYHGHDEVTVAVTRSHDHWVGSGHTFRPGDRADTHHGIVRLTWNMYGPGGGEPVSVGTDFITLDDDGRIVADHQFIDR